jgi:Bacterial dipeptidyl-peptidase Sh3 domain/NlpC/P60 family
VNPFDPRLMAARPDLAAKHLEGKVAAARFVAGELHEVIAPHAPLRRTPAPDAPLDTEALKGERAMIYEITDEGFAWGQLEADGYVGWLPAEALRRPGQFPTHKVAALRTLVFPGPSIKIAPVEALSLGVRLAVVRNEGPFAMIAGGGFVPLQHLAPADERESDFVLVAEKFLGVPYLWGGKTSFGLDCSALVQIALAACGISCPRDSDMQERAVGVPVEQSSALSNLQRGDLVFWPGHVAIARDATSLVHANAFRMAVAIEPVSEAFDRIRATGSEPTSVRRIFSVPQ